MDQGAIAGMLKEDRAEWEALLAVLDARQGLSLHDPGSPAWTPRDVFTHLACWINHSTDGIDARLAGGAVAPLEGSDDDINARVQEEGSHLSHNEARAQAEQAFNRRVDSIEAIPHERWDTGFEALSHADGHEHYAAHRSFIVDS